MGYVCKDSAEMPSGKQEILPDSGAASLERILTGLES